MLLYVLYVGACLLVCVLLQLLLSQPQQHPAQEEHECDKGKPTQDQRATVVPQDIAVVCGQLQVGLLLQVKLSISSSGVSLTQGLWVHHSGCVQRPCEPDAECAGPSSACMHVQTCGCAFICMHACTHL